MAGNSLKKLTDKQKAFVTAYLRTFNKTRSAIMAGYSAATAYTCGCDVYSLPHVKAEIERLVADNTISEVDNIKIISEIASTNLADYYRPVTRVITKKVKTPLSVIIKRLSDEIDFEDEIFMTTETDGPETKAYEREQDARRRWLSRLELKLEKEPEAFVIENGEPELIEEMELDVSALVRAGVRIKSHAIDKYGNPKIEVYSALDAADKLGKIKGSFRLDNEQRAPVIPIMNVDPLAEIEDPETPEISTEENDTTD